MKDIIDINIIPSKSFAHRAVILASLCEESPAVTADLDSDDIEATRACVKNLKEGAPLDDKGDIILPCKESGSTLRFLLPVVSALGKSAKLVTEGRLGERPLGPLEKAMADHGATVTHEDGGIIRVSGKLSGGTFRLPGDVSSQFITGILLALPITGGGKIELTSPLESKGYVDITMEVMSSFGVDVEVSGDTYSVGPGASYHRKDGYIVEGDYSGAAFWIAAGAIGDSPVRVSGLEPDSRQGDRKIIDIAKDFGAKIECDRTKVTTYPSKLKGITVDVSDVPDLAPAIAVFGAAAEGITKIINAGRLRLKESDRIDAIVSALRAAGIGAFDNDDEITVTGAGLSPGEETVRPLGGEIDTRKDHRIVMMAAVLSLMTAGKVTVKDHLSCSKSYPGFFDEMEKAGLMDGLILK